jgi:hypothetical protein
MVKPEPAAAAARVARPRYPAEKANLALRLGVNVAMYAITH